MKKYAVCLNTADSETFPDERSRTWWIEFYDADDFDHAQEQAENANPSSTIVCVATVPS